MEHPVLTVLAWSAGTVPGRVVGAAALLGLLALFSRTARRLLAPLWRLVTGGTIFWPRGPWDSYWLYPAPERPANAASFKGEHYPRTRWGKLPGYRRMLARWAVAGYALALWRWPLPVMVATAAVVLALAARTAARLAYRWGLRRVAGLFVTAAAPLLGLSADRDPASWIAVPRPRLVWDPFALDPRVLRIARRMGEKVERIVGNLRFPKWQIPLQDDDAKVRIALPATEIRRDAIEAVKQLACARMEGGPWEATHRERDLSIELRHPKRPPSSVWYTADVNQQYAVDEVPIGMRAGNEWVTLPVRRLTPHGIVSASTGWGKTTIANVIGAHVAGNGARVLLNDPKRIGYLRGFADLPHVSIASTVEGWVAHVEAFHAEMQRRYALIERHPEIEDDPAAYFQPWFLLTDERGSYVSEIKAWWKREGGTGLPEPLRLEKLNLWQARAAGMYLVDLAQQANLDVFLDSDGRDQRMWRIAAGPQTRSAWLMMFPGTPKQSVPAKKGRALLGIGPDNVEEIQLAQISVADARAFAQAGAAIAERENAEREKRIAALSGASVPASAPASVPAETPPSVPGQARPGQSPAPARENGAAAVAVLTELAPENDTESPDDPPELIVGNAAAADFLGMTRASFEKARQRRAIPGEVRSGASPAWPPLALREWRAQAPRAGRDQGERE